MKCLPLLIPILPIALCGCSGREAALEGKWTCTDIIRADHAPPTGRGAQLIDALKKNTNIQFKQDKSFAMSFVLPIAGTWSLDGSTVTMTTKTVLGMDIDQVKKAEMDKAKKNPSAQNQLGANDSATMVCTLSADGKTLTLSPNRKGTIMTFAKQANS